MSSKVNSKKNSNKKQNEEKVLILECSMADQMKNKVVNLVKENFKKLKMHKHTNLLKVAKIIKEEFDKEYFPVWHCIIGEKFGSRVTHESNRFLFFIYQGLYILLFKSGSGEIIKEEDTE